MRRNGFAPLLLIVLVAILAVLVVIAVLLFNQGKSPTSSEQTPAPVSESASPAISPTPAVKAGWTTYKNAQYGFEISFPKEYKALDDADNLYGWPNGIVLIYGGGQAYDIAVEVWNSKAAYEAKYPPGTRNLLVKETGGKFITVAAQTEEAVNSEIISTFTLTE